MLLEVRPNRSWQTIPAAFSSSSTNRFFRKTVFNERFLWILFYFYLFAAARFWTISLFFPSNNFFSQLFFLFNRSFMLIGGNKTKAAKTTIWRLTVLPIMYEILFYISSPMIKIGRQNCCRICILSKVKLINCLWSNY